MNGAYPTRGNPLGPLLFIHQQLISINTILNTNLNLKKTWWKVLGSAVSL
jgi:hypothetical protein